ncbi:N-acetyl-gamma-glutamyl-phosphate reductase [Alicyclobacillus contaminans]|uniref:N-acetyl-gamma-glutamyl-phosphate reductase n=1 Tax=Alicyclobacillus contaminans TaxID=392016 RepID=UPI000422E87A|nr:N-acetyl-gamma-glutamyl-phosphate reductase [Alicyclobacillus contaminans]GMA50607.1 N-acetyl-gamma-glutamyl-phosphate reductase [Alicyclobacillus contaminans]
MTMRRVRVGVVGATGYSGLELLRILSQHPHVDVTYVAASKGGEQSIGELEPFLPRQVGDRRVEAFEPDAAAERCDAVFVGLPSGTAGAIALQLRDRGLTAIDLSGDLRLPRNAYEAWYRKPALLDHPEDAGAVYGLTEWQRDRIGSARLISNPGCYATAVLLALLPVVRANLYSGASPLVVDAKSGVSGAGRKPLQHLMFGELQENFYAYRIGSHQHTPEIAAQLGLPESQLLLTTQLLPVARGIFASIYVPVAARVTEAEIRDAFEQAYADARFVRVLPAGQSPQLKHVRGSNDCHIGYHLHEANGTLQVFSVIDNLQKGAAGQAVQNLNVIFGFPEDAGLHATPLYP